MIILKMCFRPSSREILQCGAGHVVQRKARPRELAQIKPAYKRVTDVLSGFYDMLGPGFSSLKRLRWSGHLKTPPPLRQLETSDGSHLTEKMGFTMGVFEFLWMLRGFMFCLM